MRTSTTPAARAGPGPARPGPAGPVTTRPGRRARILARVLATIATVLAVGAGVTAAAALPAADPAVLMVETWRAVGFFTFAALFALLAARPLASPALWLIVLGNKLVLAVAGLGFGAGVAGALEAAAWDGAIVLLLGAGYAAAMVARRAGPDASR